MDEQAHSEARSRLPPLNALRHFEAVARGGSFAAAALELHVTHWAVGKQIRVLEDWFGVPLFKRLARGVVLTDDGAALLSDVTGAFSRLAAGAARLRHEESSPRLSGVVRVNVMPSFAACWLLPRLGDFHERYPGVDVRVSTTSRKLRYVGDAFDVGVRSGTDDGPGWISRPLMADRRLPACSPSVLRQRPLQSAADLRMHTLLHSATTRADWSHWLKQAGVGDVRLTHQVEYDHVFFPSAHQVPRHTAPAATITAANYCLGLTDSCRKTRAITIANTTLVSRRADTVPMAPRSCGTRPASGSASAWRTWQAH